jgi:hypothetical protein
MHLFMFDTEQLEVLPMEPRWVAPEVSCDNIMLSYRL